MSTAFHPMQPIQEMDDHQGAHVDCEDIEGDEEGDPEASANERLVGQHSKSDDKTKLITVRVIIAAVLAALGGVLFGYDVGVVSGALLQLTREFGLTCLQQEMVVSSLLLGALGASLTGGFLVDHVGRRSSIIGNAGIFIVGAIILSCAQNFPTLICGRLVVGFAVSLSAIAECVYISEISPPNQRGLLVSLNELGITAGFLAAYLINLAFISTSDGWRYMFGFSMVPAFLQGLGMTLLPPSPRFQMIRKEEDEKFVDHFRGVDDECLWCGVAKARFTLVKLRGTEDVEEELCSIRDSLSSQQPASMFDLCRAKGNMGFRFLLGLGIVFFQQFTGQSSVLYYAPTIFLSIGFGSDAAAMVVTVGLGVVKVFFTAVALLCVDCGGRRKFLIGGTLMMLVGVASLGFAAMTQRPGMLSDSCQLSQLEFFDTDGLNNSATGSVLDVKRVGRHRRDHSIAYPFQIPASNHTPGAIPRGAISAHVKWISFLALVVYIAGYAVGFGPMSWLVLSEIFPSQIRGRAISMATVANWGTNLIVSFTFLDLMKVLSLPGTFLLYAAMCATALLYIYLLVPETKGQTLEDISSHLNGRYLAADIRCCTPRFGLRLRLADDSDLENVYKSVNQSTSYSLLARE